MVRRLVEEAYKLQALGPGAWSSSHHILRMQQSILPSWLAYTDFLELLVQDSCSVMQMIYHLLPICVSINAYLADLRGVEEGLPASNRIKLHNEFITM